jgi:hypothetical protein
MTDMASESHQRAAPPARSIGRHRAAADRDHQPAENTRGYIAAGVAPETRPVPPDMAVARALVAAKDPTRRSAVATLLPAGVGASAFHAAIEAARQSALRRAQASYAGQSQETDVEPNQDPGPSEIPSETPPDVEPGRRHWRRKRVNGHLTEVRTG